MDKNTKEENINVNIEIDYDRLATAIVKAQEKVKADQEEKFTQGIFSLLTSWVLHIIGALGLFIALYALGYGIYHAVKILQWIDGVHIFGNILTCLFILAIIFCVGVLSFMILKAGSEIQKSKDKNFVVSVFSALSGFIALVVALIALFK